MDFSLLTSKNWKDRVTFYQNFDWQCDNTNDIIKIISSESIVPALEPAITSLLKCAITDFENTKPIFKNVSNVKLKNLFFLYFEKALFYEIYKIQKTIEGHNAKMKYFSNNKNNNVITIMDNHTNHTFDENLFFDTFLFLNTSNCKKHTKKMYKRKNSDSEIILYIQEAIKTQKNSKIVLFYCELLNKITKFLGPIYDINIVNNILQHSDPLVRKEGVELCVTIYDVIEDAMYESLVNIKEIQMKEIKERIEKSKLRTIDVEEVRKKINNIKDCDRNTTENNEHNRIDKVTNTENIQRKTDANTVNKERSNIDYRYKDNDYNDNKDHSNKQYSNNNNDNGNKDYSYTNNIDSHNTNNMNVNGIYIQNNNVQSGKIIRNTTDNNNKPMLNTFLDTQLFNTYYEKHMHYKNRKPTIEIPENIKTELKSSNYKERLNALQNILKFPYKLCSDTTQQIIKKINDPNLQVTTLAIESMLLFNMTENVIKMLVERLKEKKLKEHIQIVLYLQRVKCNEINSYVKNQKNPQVKLGILEFYIVLLSRNKESITKEMDDVVEDILVMSKDCNKDVRMLANKCLEKIQEKKDISSERKVNERQVNERQLNERLTNERQLNERLTNERQVNERRLNERLTNERPSTARQINPRQVNERQVNVTMSNTKVNNRRIESITKNIEDNCNNKFDNGNNTNMNSNEIGLCKKNSDSNAKRKRKDAIIKNMLKNRTKNCRNKELIFNEYFIELLNQRDCFVIDKVLSLFDCSDRIYLSDFIIEYIQKQENYYKTKNNKNVIDRLCVYLNNLIDYYIENEHVLNKCEIEMMYEMVNNKDHTIKNEIYDKLKYVYPESKLNKIIKKNTIEELNSSLLVCNIKCDSPCKKVKSIAKDIKIDAELDTVMGKIDNGMGNEIDTGISNEIDTGIGAEIDNGISNEIDSLSSITNLKHTYNTYKNDNITQNDKLNIAKNNATLTNKNNFDSFENASYNFTAQKMKDCNPNTIQNIDSILLDLIHSDKNICYNSFVTLNQIIINNIDLLFLKSNSLVSSILIQINDTFELKNENIYIIFDCFNKIMKNESFLKELSKISIKNIILECTRMVTYNANSNEDNNNENKNHKLLNFVRSSASQVLLDILYNPNLALNLEVLLDLLIYFIQKNSSDLEKDVISKLVWRHSKFCKSKMKDKAKVQEIIKVIEYFYENNCGKVLKSDVKMCKVIQLHLIEIHNEYNENIYNFEFGSFVKRIVDKIGMSRKNNK